MSLARTVVTRLRNTRDWAALPSAARRAHRHDTRIGLGKDPGTRPAVREALGWLCRAQDHSVTADGGAARHYSLIDGWGPSYPETTGYIVPTMLSCAPLYEESDLAQRGQRMLDWLLAIQLPSGAFQGGTILDEPVVPVTFNTGQILIGLAAGAARFGEPYTQAMHDAARWLVDAQDADGCWRRHASPFAGSGENSYDTHISWGLLEAARASGEEAYAESALRNIRWAMSRQLDNGWFSSCCLHDPKRPLTHTLGYAVRGIIEGYLYSRDEALLDSAVRAAEGLASALAANGFLPGRIASDWRGTVPWACLTGSVQIASCWLLLYRETGNGAFRDAAWRANEYVRRTIAMDGPPGERGGVRGAFPISGRYNRYQYLNWAAKFFVDANMLEETIRGDDQAGAPR